MERLGIRRQTYDVIQKVNAMTDGKGVSPKEAGVNMIEVFSFEHDKVDQNFLVENTSQYYDSKEF
ncbi:20379_t:CDS:2 [Dentiscutata erythropus]|uniref:20379_t:CDS:1 n=1 Tax=Dentiscutata erythropus TaxID=1348616 RepID=A0A9N9F289_9GLOM|nr:20379_t:CDS:2 [Dentiscutata erythropus]